MEKITLKVGKYESGYGICSQVEKLIMEHRIEKDGCPPIIVKQAFPWLAGYPADPWGQHAKGFRGRVVAEARKLGIEVIEEPEEPAEGENANGQA